VLFDHANLTDADLSGADLTGARFEEADLSNADLHGADLTGIDWRQIAAVRNANLTGVKNAPDGFVTWAIQQGAIQDQSAR
jgi:uncharacterized protein YjbI with pentapeptide repeats